MKRRAFLRAVLMGAATLATGNRPGRAELDAVPLWRSRPRRSPRVVAGTISRSGAYAAFGVPAERALRLWAEQRNAAGGVAGRPVMLRLEDDASDADTVRRLYPALAHEADLLLAPYGSTLTRVALAAAEEVGVPCLAPTAGDPDVWRDGRAWSVQLLNPVDTTLHPTLRLAAEIGLRDVTFLHRDDPYTTRVIDGAAAHASRVGLRIGLRERYDGERAARRAAAGLPGELIVGLGFRAGGAGAGFLDDAVMLADALRVAGVRPRLLSLGIGAADARFASRAAGRVEHVLGTTGWRAYLPTPGRDAFVRAYRDRWGTEPDTHAAQAYGAGELYLQAARHALADAADASVAVPGERAAERRRVRDALFALDTETVFGRYRVDARGAQTGKTNAVMQWQDGRPVVIVPARYRTGRLVAPRAGAGRTGPGTARTARQRT